MSNLLAAKDLEKQVDRAVADFLEVMDRRRRPANQDQAEAKAEFPADQLDLPILEQLKQGRLI
jgi:hypothetical protein